MRHVMAGLIVEYELGMHATCHGRAYSSACMRHVMAGPIVEYELGMHAICHGRAYSVRHIPATV